MNDTISKKTQITIVKESHTNVKPRYSIIMPAFNEAERIGNVLPTFLQMFHDSEVIVVMNGCTDETESEITRVAHGHVNLRLMKIDFPIGKGGAIRAGFLHAKAPLVGYVDADGATSACEMRRLFDTFTSQDDGIIGSRWLNDSRVTVDQPLIRRAASRVFNLLVRILFGMRFGDTQCGAKVFRLNQILEISPSLEISNFAFDIDLLYLLQRRGARVREIPITWEDRSGSRVNLPRASFQMAASAIRLRIRHSTFRYIIPLFDRLWPTRPLRLRHRSSILVISSHDPNSPQSSEPLRTYFKLLDGFGKNGFIVHWMSSRSKGLPRRESIGNITIFRFGSHFFFRFLVPFLYLRHFRDTYDVIVDIGQPIPMFSPLFTMKPVVTILLSAANTVSPGRIKLLGHTIIARFLQTYEKLIPLTIYQTSSASNPSPSSNSFSEKIENMLRQNLERALAREHMSFFSTEDGLWLVSKS